MIQSVRQEDLIRQAVGFVVCSTNLISLEGKSQQHIDSTGSAFAVTLDGYLLTNRHVIENAANRMEIPLPVLRDENDEELRQKPQIWVFFGGEKYEAQVVGRSDRHDLAVLKIDRDAGPYFRLSQQDQLARGTKVYALGFPGAASSQLSDQEEVEEIVKSFTAKTVETALKERDMVYTQTHGEVSRVVTEQSGRSWLQHSAPMSWGNSGGPLVTEDGLVVGINTRVSFAQDVEVPDAMKIVYALATLGLANDSQLQALKLKNSTVPILGPGTFFSLPPSQAREEIEQRTGLVVWE